MSSAARRADAFQSYRTEAQLEREHKVQTQYFGIVYSSFSVVGGTFL